MVSVSLDLNASISAYTEEQSFDLGRQAGRVFMTVADLHDWYRALWGRPETLGLSPGARRLRGCCGALPRAACGTGRQVAARPLRARAAGRHTRLPPSRALPPPALPPAASFADLTEPEVQLEGANYEAQGVSVNVNDSSWFYAGSDASWRSYPSIKIQPGASANDSAGCVARRGAGGGAARGRAGCAAGPHVGGLPAPHNQPCELQHTRATRLPLPLSTPQCAG